MKRLAAALLAGLAAAAGLMSPARSADPAAMPPALYGIAPTTHQHYVDAADGTPIFVETWLPAAKDGNVPPAKVPTIVTISPYLTEGDVDAFVRDLMVPRGYAYANVHVRGTGHSGGCIDLFGGTEADDSARAIEYLGRDAPWSDGNVGGYGISYPGGTVLSAAGRGDPERTKYLKAIVSGAPYHSMHEARWMFDGVASFVVSNLMAPSYSATSYGLDYSGSATPPPLARIPSRAGCLPMHNVESQDLSGDHTFWHQQRDNRAWTYTIKAATFIFHGHADLTPNGGSPPSIEVGLFDQLPEGTPKHGMFGVFGHHRPPRPDFPAKMVAWFDRYLKGRDTGVETWPPVEVQGTDGEWFEGENWPVVGGRQVSLALGPSTLGDVPGTGSTSYVETSWETTRAKVPGTFAVFETPPLQAPLELVGQPVLDLWVKLSLPDAHIAARIETFDAAGKPIANGHTYGLRSARHLEPFEYGRFVQAEGKAPPTNRPILVPVRFQPTALVVPAGGRLRLTIAGSLIVNPGLAQLGIPEPFFRGPSQPSGSPTEVTILHNAAYPSALHFDRRPGR